MEVGNFYGQSLLTPRTMLGAVQLQDLKDELLAAQQNGVTWKFVAIPEPIQNLGALNASDRYEGYGYERTELLKFIDDNHIQNVVFVAADIHGTLVNNLGYQTLGMGGSLITKPTSAWEITTGSVAYADPFGQTVLDLAAGIPVGPGVSLLDVFLGGVGVPDLASFYAFLTPAQQNAALEGLINQVLTPLGFSPVGLEDSGLDVTLHQGDYTAVFGFGWTEFEIDPLTKALTVTTYSIPNYDASSLPSDPSAIDPTIVSRFTVGAVIPEPSSALMLLLGVVGLTLRPRRR